MKRTNCSYIHQWTAAVSATFAAIVLMLSPASAQAKILTFDNVTTNFQDNIPNGYGGLMWTNFGAVDGVDYVSSGYQAAVVSTNYVAYSVGLTDAVLTAGIAARNGHLLALKSGYFTAAWNDDLQLQITGYHGKRKVFDKTYTLSSTQPLFIKFPFVALTRVTFTASGGTPHGYSSGSGEHFAIDNLKVQEN